MTRFEYIIVLLFLKMIEDLDREEFFEIYAKDKKFWDEPVAISL